MSETLIFLSQNLAFLRKETQMTQADLAGKLGVKPNTISNYENGNSMPDLDTVQKLTGIFHIPADVLLYSKLNHEILGALQEVADQLKKLVNEKKQVVSGPVKGAVVAGGLASVVGLAGIIPAAVLTSAAMLGYRSFLGIRSKEAGSKTYTEVQKGDTCVNDQVGEVADESDGTSSAETENFPVPPALLEETKLINGAERIRLTEEIYRKDEIIMDLSRKIGRLEYEIELLRGKQNNITRDQIMAG